MALQSVFLPMESCLPRGNGVNSRSNYNTQHPGQFYAAGVFFNVEVPEMQQALSPSADTSAEGGVGCQDTANAQSQLLLPD